jgi:hypothetical protein
VAESSPEFSICDDLECDRFAACRRILGDRPFAESGEPVLAVVAEGRLAVAGDFVHESRRATVAVYDIGDLTCRAVLPSRYPVHALAFHPTLPLLAVGTGSYDGGYFFEGELLLLDLETSTAVSLFEHELGRQVLGLEWLDDQELRLLMAPPDDWQDQAARVEGHVALVRRDDWRSVAPESIEPEELAGLRIPMPRWASSNASTIPPRRCTACGQPHRRSRCSPTSSRRCCCASPRSSSQQLPQPESLPLPRAACSAG